ncbi:patatin-like phospholipase family protein [Emcibacter sp. SYSU 3D8]|uniref:patatin-like phospholipase family protein n=1 Tax=Emcibacter sp. SYSU 3D8 TaxID=3133969 RepID=UPI0031FEA64C
MTMNQGRKPVPEEKTVLVLQGGGALGAYQAGVFEKLAESGCAPAWLAGISIGAINAALIAGNPPERRVERLKTFWDMASSQLLAEPVAPGVKARTIFNDAAAAWAALFGLPGFFKPRFPPFAVYPAGAPEALSVYDTAPLRATLEKLVDFDLLNAGEMRLSVGAVNVRTANFAYFDTARQRIGPEHIMASGALPPGFPPVEIEGELYWDGGLVSNTPLEYVLEHDLREDMLIFQVDLFSATGPIPETLLDAAEREKDIRYSSRTRLNTDVATSRQEFRRAAHRLLAKLPPPLRDDPDARLLSDLSCDAAITIVHLINRRKNYFTRSKDVDFSRFTVEENWRAGADDVCRTFNNPAWHERSKPKQGVTVLDLTRSGT